jgi:hypothetical protein
MGAKNYHVRGRGSSGCPLIRSHELERAERASIEGRGSRGPVDLAIKEANEARRLCHPAGVHRGAAPADPTVTEVSIHLYGTRGRVDLQYPRPATKRREKQKADELFRPLRAGALEPLALAASLRGGSLLLLSI